MECVTTTSFSISINGSLHGNFKGKRGLRQGDPLSPYLFTLIMEVFTLILHRRVQEAFNFTYHSFCSELELINLCFADDILLYCSWDVNSRSFIRKRWIIKMLREERLPVKYLGVPLVSSRLIFRDCKELIDKVQNRVNDWKTKSLSIAERLQLIQSVLGSLHVYWASVFMLPTRVLLDIEQIMRGFLWCHGSMCRGKAKVAWDVVCLPKQEGGLGVRRLDHFNKALMVSHVWKLLSLKESLWVKWIHVYKLNNRSFWDIPYRGTMSWSWRKLLLLRPLIREFIWSCIGGWAGFTHASKVRDCIQDGLWKWPNDWLVKYPLLNSIPVPTIIDDNPDSLEWRSRDGIGKPFSVHNVWDSIRPRDNLVLDSCSTGLPGLTGAGPSLASIVTHLMPIAKRKSSKSCIGKLVVAAAAYFVWQERNARLFNKVKRSVTDVVDCIISAVRLKLFSCRFKKSKEAILFARLWEIPMSNLK
ncbi:hypothetical protein Tco_1368998 [Tanacetum coccineum]